MSDQQLIPFGQSVLPHIFNKDPQTQFIKQFYLIGASFLLIIWPFIPYILVQFIFHSNIQTYSQINIYQIAQIIGLSNDTLCLAIIITSLGYILLIILDIYGVRWTDALNTKNVQCYVEMFCEPRRTGLISHVGNTLSNFMYLFDGLCVLFCCFESNNQFFISDVLFGIMLVLLSIFSVLWHASNAPKIHYFDLYVMENCIVYLPIRYICLALFKFGYIYWTEKIGIVTAIIVYLWFIFKNGKRRLQHLMNGRYDNSFGASCRRRLSENDVGVKDVCLYLMQPIIFSIGPIIACVYLRSLGHLTAITISVFFLNLGWGIRTFERFMLDGWAPINRFKNSIIMSALLSPTAILHISTGVTLITGYIHVRSLE